MELNSHLNSNQNEQDKTIVTLYHGSKGLQSNKNCGRKRIF